MNKEHLYFRSADGKTRVAGYIYTSETTKPRAVIQISHGMCEYIERYEPMIRVLTAAGYAVCGNDHLGHGGTGKPEDYGFFAEENGYKLVLEDMRRMNLLARNRFKGLPLILFGHSMGSFFARWYAQVYPGTIKGLVISGTAGGGPLIQSARSIAAAQVYLHGPRAVSKFLVDASTGAYVRPFPEGGSPHAWLSRDPEVWEKYGADPRCTFSFTVSAYRDMLTVLLHVNTKEWARALPKNLPILMYSGEQDPVGEFGKGIRAVEELLLQANIRDLTVRLYPEGRHEMHNELNKEEVFSDLLAWCNRVAGK